jgi:hypothetical protein
MDAKLGGEVGRPGWRAPATVVALASAATAALVWYAAGDGPRGSDQFWYVADVDRLVHGQDDTNQIYPNTVPIPGTSRARFVHNLVNLHLVVPFARVFGAFHGWLVANLVAVLAAGALLAFVVARHAGRRAGVFAFALFLSLPLTVWLTTQPLAEATTAPFVALALLLFTVAGRSVVGWVLVAAALGVAAWGRVNLVLLLLAVPLAHLASERPWTRRGLLRVSVSGALSFAMAFAVVYAFRGKSNVACPLPVMLNPVDMNCHFGDGPTEFHLPTLIGMSVRNVWLQIGAPLAQQPFYVPFNVLGAGGLLLALGARDAPSRRLGLAAAAFLGLHLATVAGLRNQPRYMFIALPVVLAAAVVYAAGHPALSRVTGYRWAAAVVAVGLVVNLVPVKLVREQSHVTAQGNEALKRVLDEVVPPGDPVLFEATAGHYQVFGYLAEPRIAGYVVASQSPEHIERFRQRIGARWLLAISGSPLLRSFPERVPVSDPLPPPYESFRLYRIDARSSAVRADAPSPKAAN